MRHVETTPGTLPKIAISAALIALAIAAIHLAPAPTPPYKMVDEVARSVAHWDGKRVRLHGGVRPGTIVHVTDSVHVFTLQRNGEAMRIWHTGAVPDTFHDGAEVIVSGTVQGRWVSSTEVFAKCATRYEGQFPVGPRTKFQ